MMLNRRNFLRLSLLGAAAAACEDRFNDFQPGNHYYSNVSLTTGSSRADIAFRALLPFSDEIKTAIGEKQVVIKPNIVSTTVQLSATHADTLEGVLEFLTSIGKINNVVIAESSARESSLNGYCNFGYDSVAGKFNVKLVDLDNTDKIDIVNVFSQNDSEPVPVRFSGLLLSPRSYIISVARLKTHDRVIATLSLKNIIVGAALKDPGYYPNNHSGLVSDKPIIHGGGKIGINYNLYTLAYGLHPHLAVIDGYEGMEGNGPVDGTAVDHRVCIASPDWLAADRVGVELMGIDFSLINYLNLCSDAFMGIADMNRIHIIGESIHSHIKKYKLHENFIK